MKTKLHKNLETEHKKQLEMRPLYFLLIVLSSCLILLLGLRLLSPLYIYKISLWVFVCSATVGTILFFYHYISRHHKIIKTAQLVDAEHGGKNRLETAWELRKSNHPLKHKQQESTTEFYQNRKFSNWGTVRLFLIAVLLLLSGTNAVLLRKQYDRFEKAVVRQKEKEEKNRIKKKKEKEKKKSSPKKKVPEDYAELKLVMPEAETRAKPLDEIEWAGVGKSSRGFKEIYLSIFLNGKFIKDIVPDSPPAPSPGNIKINGFLALDEFNVKPYDLVSYHLTAYSDMNGKKHYKIISPPQFIEIRPFREDAFLSKGNLNGQGQKMLNVLVRFLQLQVEINKATFRARIMRQHQFDKATRKKFCKFFSAVEEEQRKLHSEVEEFLNSKIARDFPADSINNIEKASDDIDACCMELKKIIPGEEK